MKAHATAQIDPAAEIAADVEIGPFCAVGAGVQIGPGCRLLARVVVTGPAAIGSRNVFHPNSVIGGGAPAAGGRIEIGDDNVFREGVTVNFPASAGTTRIGSRNRFHPSFAVGPDCSVGDDSVFGTFGALSARSTIRDRAWIEGSGGTADDVLVSRGGWVRSHTVAVGDVPPFMGVTGDVPAVFGVNPHFRSPALEQAFQTVWKSGLPAAEALQRLASDPSPEVAELVAFLRRPARKVADE